MRTALLKEIEKKIDSLDELDASSIIAWNDFKKFTQEFYKDWNKKLDKRKVAFTDTIKPYVDKYGSAMCNEFFKYWTEHSPTHRKMRFEKETSFDISKRLARWAKGNNVNVNETTTINLSERKG